MRLHEQVETLKTAATEAEALSVQLRARLARKCAATYPDGTRDNRVNVETDVLPALFELERLLGYAVINAER